MLEHNKGEREVELLVIQRRQGRPVHHFKRHIREIAQTPSRLTDHFIAYINSGNVPKDPCERSSHSPNATSKFEHSEVQRSAVAADPRHVWHDLVGDTH